MDVTVIRNETPSTLKLVGADDEILTLGPLQEKEVDEPRAFDFKRAEGAGIISRRPWLPFSKLVTWIGGAAGLSLYVSGFVAVTIMVEVDEPPWGLALQAWQWFVWGTVVLLVLTITVAVTIYITNSLLLVARSMAQVLALAVILAIGVGLPAATMYFFGGGSELLAKLDSSPLPLFGRLIQLSFIATASLLPVLLFFLFDRFQLGTLRKRLYFNLFRLDPSVRTISDIDAKYGPQIAEAYGSEEQGPGRLAPGSRWPVLVCAFVITIGWLITLAPVGKDFAPTNAPEALRGLLPQQTALAFGFLGAYFFSLRLIAIRYARGDLKPKAYSYIMVRILIVAVLSWVLDAIFDRKSIYMLVLAFLFGIMPDEFFTYIKEKFRTVVPASIFPEPTRLPLTDLEGIDLYDRGRLESEGIVNIEGLAHHELFDLIIETRVPVPRLIDWIDQAILYLHLAGGSDTAARAKLRDYGIRTATDLLAAWDGAKQRGDAEFKTFRKLLGEDEELFRLEVIRDALLDDEWMQTVRNWRKDARFRPIEVEACPR